MTAVATPHKINRMHCLKNKTRFWSKHGQISTGFQNYFTDRLQGKFVCMQLKKNFHLAMVRCHSPGH